jgi:hypothetical protein
MPKHRFSLVGPWISYAGLAFPAAAQGLNYAAGNERYAVEGGVQLLLGASCVGGASHSVDWDYTEFLQDYNWFSGDGTCTDEIGGGCGMCDIDAAFGAASGEISGTFSFSAGSYTLSFSASDTGMQSANAQAMYNVGGISNFVIAEAVGTVSASVVLSVTVPQPGTLVIVDSTLSCDIGPCDELAGMAEGGWSIAGITPAGGLWVGPCDLDTWNGSPEVPIPSGTTVFEASFSTEILASVVLRDMNCSCEVPCTGLASTSGGCTMHVFLRYYPGPVCEGDTDGDGDIDAEDLAAVLSGIGGVASNPDSDYNSDVDLNGDGAVDIADLALVLSSYGTTC